MRVRSFGGLGEVSELTLGGGGLGQGWGLTSREEAVATLEAAVAAGITLIDVAPSYESKTAPREAEHVVGATFAGTLPPGVRIVTKVGVEDEAPDELITTIRESLEESLRIMRLDHVDVLLHHAYLRPPRLSYAPPTLALDLFRDVVRPEFEALRSEGLIKAWGLTATGHPEAVFEALAEVPLPAVVQTPTNLLDSPGDLWTFGESESPDNAGTRERATAAGIGVMGIRAVQGGALTNALDRDEAADPERLDFEKAAGFRDLAARKGVSAAFLAYRYALSMDNVDTIVLGVKNRAELGEGLAAEAAGPLSEEELHEVRMSVGG
jgi:aryl-alcohol dehydrogenase-like predicted oxidoreductase